MVKALWYMTWVTDLEYTTCLLIKCTVHTELHTWLYRISFIMLEMLWGSQKAARLHYLQLMRDDQYTRLYVKGVGTPKLTAHTIKPYLDCVLCPLTGPSFYTLPIERSESESVKCKCQTYEVCLFWWMSIVDYNDSQIGFIFWNVVTYKSYFLGKC